jgi:hypothetical protein
LLVVGAVIALCGAGVAVAVARRDSGGVVDAAFVQGAPERDAALQALLDRRAKAVKAHDKTAFMADVDPIDAAFVRKQQQEYDNLAALPLTDFRYTLEPSRRFDELVDKRLRERFPMFVEGVGVTVLYQIEGVDTAGVAAPWVPAFGLSGGRWLLVAELSDKSLPLGVGGQPWDAGSIKVVRSDRVTVVLSADDTNRADRLLRMAEEALNRVLAVRRTDWTGKIFMTAVQERRIFDTYFADSPDRVGQVAAIAVPYYAKVPDWSRDPTYAATRVVFNPEQLSADENELFHDLTHEFTHAAMGPLTTRYTPSWLVEGFAEYVPYKTEDVPSSWLHRVLNGVTVDELPDDQTFYGEPRNYVTAWLACRLIAEKYGEGKLIKLYSWFKNGETPSDAIGQVLGTSEESFTAQWRQYVGQAKTSTLP